MASRRLATTSSHSFLRRPVAPFSVNGARFNSTTPPKPTKTDSEAGETTNSSKSTKPNEIETLYPNYKAYNPLFDSYTTMNLNFKMGDGKILFYNNPPLFVHDPEQRNVRKTTISSSDGPLFDENGQLISEEEASELNLEESVSQLYNEEGEWINQSPANFMLEQDPDPYDTLVIPQKEASGLMRFPLVSKRVVQQTSKGRMASTYVLMVVGNGKGLVGAGEGKDENNLRAIEKAFNAACKAMDYVDMFEGRTLWHNLETKFGSTKVLMRPRPMGFGLRCNPYIHQICKAAGMKDVSAKVWGSRNGMNVIKATLRLLHGGFAPPMLGDGNGGPGKRLESGYGMRGKESIQWERGRKLRDERIW